MLIAERTALDHHQSDSPFFNDTSFIYFTKEDFFSTKHIYLFVNRTLLFFLQMKFMSLALFIHIKFQQTHKNVPEDFIFLALMVHN